MNDHRNTILAIVLSAIILIAWQYFFALPQAEKQKAQQQAQQTQQQGAPTPQANGAPAAPGAPSREATAPRTREAALADSRRIAIETPSISGSISLKGARIDDVALVKYRETVDPKSPAIVLLSPSGSPHPYYAEFGWVPAAGGNVRVPGPDTVWTQQGDGKLTPSTPVALTFDNGAGLVFRRTIAVDANYLFTIRDEVENTSGNAATLYPYALVSRHGMPHTAGYYVLHEGMIGVLGEQGLQEISYSKLDDKKNIPFNVTNAWLGITDKYWAATLLPDPAAKLQARFMLGSAGTTKTYQADYLGEPVTVAPNASIKTDARLFAGAKEVSQVDAYDKALSLNRFELLIDWGWFYFITKPMFWAIDLLYKLLGNFGLAILAVTVVIKAIFFPLANKSYASMAKMKAAQPKMMEIRERYAGDKMKQQQEMMELYKKEKINPVSGCLPILIQIPVFFALYKVLFVTIEMRHAPFFGWIHDLSAPDPTNIFTLFGLIPWDPGALPVIGPFLLLGIWPIIMGITMWFQMKLNPAPPDPTQQMIFDWMPLIFTFMLASFPAGLVIYWAWNNFLSVLQQAAIMRRHGVKIELMDNLRAQFGKKKTQS